MINERLGRQFFPGQDPIGKRFMFGRPAPGMQPQWFTIVGVVADTRLYGLANPSRLEVYRAFAQVAPDSGDLVVKSRLDPAALPASIRPVVASIDREQPITAVATMTRLCRIRSVPDASLYSFSVCSARSRSYLQASVSTA